MDQKPKELLLIDPPSELHFVGPFTRPVITIMTLTNPTDYKVLFKIKTTAPKRYCVRPNFGVVEPHNYTKVDIILQPFIYDPNEKNKHKFMVQSLIMTEESDDYGTLWREAEPDQLMDAKLKCVFEMPSTYPTLGSESSQSGEAIVHENYAAPEAKPSKSSDDEKNTFQAAKVVPGMEKAEALLSELRTLRDENGALRKDITKLKEQVVRLRVSPSNPPMDEPYRPVAVHDKQIPMFYIATSVAVAIFCLLLGKYLL